MSTWMWVALGGLAAFFALKLKTTYRTASQLAAIRKALDDGAPLIDVRSPDEFASGHADGARNIPVTEITSRTGSLPAPGSPIVIYCASGIRSAAAARALKGRGLGPILDLGPMENWAKLPSDGG